MVRSYFSLLGWELSHDEAKDKGFASVFGALGVEFDLRRTQEGKLFVGNTAGRKAELSEQINTILVLTTLQHVKHYRYDLVCYLLRVRSLGVWQSSR